MFSHLFTQHLCYQFLVCIRQIVHVQMMHKKSFFFDDFFMLF